MLASGSHALTHRVETFSSTSLSLDFNNFIIINFPSKINTDKTFLFSVLSLSFDEGTFIHFSIFDRCFEEPIKTLEDDDEEDDDSFSSSIITPNSALSNLQIAKTRA